jgi:hypothetical protein
MSPVCAVSYSRASNPDAVLAEVVDRLAGRGYRVGGLLQSRRGGTASACASLFLEIGSGRQVEIFESRGGGARGCRLTTRGLAEAAGWLSGAVAAGPDSSSLTASGGRRRRAGVFATRSRRQ